MLGADRSSFHRPAKSTDNPDPANPNSDTTCGPGPEPCRRESSKHLELLEALIDNIIRGLKDKSCQPRVRDALVAIQLREKVAKSSEAEQTFWGLIDSIRKTELSKPVRLQRQIQNTILGLKDQMKNGILPLKTITDAFNQPRSQQARLTYRRMSSLLSQMGFTKARTRNGASAIIWDDELLAQEEPPPDQNVGGCGDKKNEKLSSEASEPSEPSASLVDVPSYGRLQHVSARPVNVFFKLRRKTT